MLRERACPDEPWLTRDVIAMLQTLLRPGDKGVEFGSGRSTKWLSERVAHLVSVEHDLQWYKTVQGQLVSRQACTVDYRFADIARESSDDSKAKSYLSVLNDDEPLSLDFVLVDGCYRDRCASAALEKLKPGGMLIFDNVNWYLPSNSRSPDSRNPVDGPETKWNDVYAEIGNWRFLWTSNGVTDTAIFFKPEIGQSSD